MNGLEARAQRLVVRREIARVVLRHRDHTVVDDFDDFVASEVEVHDEPFDRARVSVVERVGAQEGDAARDAAIGLGGIPEDAGGPRVDLHVVDIGDAAACQRGDVLGMFLRGEDGVHGLTEQQGGPYAVDHVPTDDRIVAEGHDHFDDAESRTVDELDLRRAHRSPLSECGLVRLVEDDVHERGVGGEARIRPHGRTCPADLATGQHLEREGGHDRMLSGSPTGVKP